MDHAEQNNPSLETIWTFVRGDMEPAEFEQWAYAETGLEGQLGERLYMETISADYSSKGSVYVIRRSLGAHARAASPLQCECITLRDLADVGMGSDADIALKTLETQAKRGPALWWLSAERCAACKQWWLMAAESRINDVYLLKRLSAREGERILDENRWPEDFNSFEKLLRLGRERGHEWAFVDPLSPALIWTAADLARARPGIGVSELAELLQLDIPHAGKVARKAIKDEGAVIDLGKKDR